MLNWDIIIQEFGEQATKVKIIISQIKDEYYMNEYTVLQ